MAKLKNLRRPARPQEPAAQAPPAHVDSPTRKPNSSSSTSSSRGSSEVSSPSRDAGTAAGTAAGREESEPSSSLSTASASQRPYALGDGLNVFIVSNDPRLAAHAASSPFGVIEYNGHDAFEFGAVGQVYIRRMSEREKMEERVWVNG